jgi:DNA-directed RNA polymerase specialized sigma24 family protein
MSAGGHRRRIGKMRRDGAQGGNRVSSEEVAAVRSRDEVANAIRAFTPAQWIRLRKVAARYAPGGHIPAQDLLQEAFVRALDEDGRKCPADVDVVKFLAEAMRSIADGEAEKVGNAPEIVPIATHDDGTDAAYGVPDGTATAEEKLAWDQEIALMRRDLLALFADDPQARDIVDGTIEGMTVDEMCAVTGLDKKAYDSKRKLIRRRIDKAYPEGWKP